MIDMKTSEELLVMVNDFLANLPYNRKPSFCWNIAQQLNADTAAAGQTISGDEIFPMAFPTESGDPKLCGGIWGFGIFDNGDEAKIKAAKTFIEFIAADPDQVKDSVLASTYFPVRTSVGDIYAGNAAAKQKRSVGTEIAL